jgi:ABC-type uncharacterized transport system substrate-binding protein
MLMVAATLGGCNVNHLASGLPDAMPCRAGKVLILSAATRAARAQAEPFVDYVKQVCPTGVTVAFEGLDPDDAVAVKAIQAHAADPPRLVVAFIQFYAEAARQAFPESEIVMTTYDDPVAIGLAESYAHPARRTTGYSKYRPLMSKRIEILKQSLSGIERVGLLTDDYHGNLASTAREIARAEADTHVHIELYQANDLPTLLRQIDTAAVDAFYVVTTGPSFFNVKTVVAQLNKRHLPAVYEDEMFAEAGGLLSVQSDNSAMLARVRQQLFAVLHGSSASDVPFEMPKTTTVTFNLAAFESFPNVNRRSLLVAQRIVEGSRAMER